MIESPTFENFTGFSGKPNIVVLGNVPYLMIPHADDRPGFRLYKLAKSSTSAVGMSG